MRRQRIAALIATATLVVAACGGDDDDSADAGTDGSSDDATQGSGGDAEGGDGDAMRVAIITSGAPNDLGWNQGLVSRAEKLEKEGRIDVTVVEQGYDVTADETLRAAADLAEDDNQVVIAHSFNYGEPLKTMVEDYPDVLFAYAGGIGDASENLADYEQPFYEPAFLAGILAGGVTKTGVLGGTAGFDIPVCHSMIAAFAEGAELTYDGEIKLLEAYIGSWGDAAKTKEAVLAQADQGADVFIPCGVDAGTIEGAKEADAGVVGYVMDQTPLAPKNVLASAVWNLDQTILAMVDDVENGDAPPARYYELGYAEGGTSVAINDGYKTPIPADVMKTYDEYAEKVKSGDFEVPYIPE